MRSSVSHLFTFKKKIRKFCSASNSFYINIKSWKIKDYIFRATILHYRMLCYVI